MATIVVGLMEDPHKARSAARALEDEDFKREEIDTTGGLVGGLYRLGVPAREAHAYAEGVRRGGTLVCVRADTESEAERAADIMAENGAVNLDACAAGWKREGWPGRIAEPQGALIVEHYSRAFGEAPAGSGRMYQPRPGPSPAERVADAKPDDRYSGPERRRRNKPYPGVNRRSA